MKNCFADEARTVGLVFVTITLARIVWRVRVVGIVRVIRVARGLKTWGWDDEFKDFEGAAYAWMVRDCAGMSLECYGGVVAYSC